MARLALMSRNNRGANLPGRAGPQRPPGQGLSKNARRRRNMRMAMNTLPKRGIRNRNPLAGKRPLTRPQRARVEMLQSLDARDGLLAVGPAMAIGNTWQNSKSMRINKVNAEGLDNMSLGSTAVGRLAAAKALHPAANIGPQRWPDKSANESIVLQNTDVWILTSNSDDQTQAWNCNLWLTNFVDCPLIVSANPSTSAWPNPQEDMKSSTVERGQVKGRKYGFFYSQPWGDGWNADQRNHPNKEFQEARITARSITIDLVSNATTNQGVVYASQYGPNVAQMAYNQKVTVFSPEQIGILADMFEKFKVSLEYDDASDAPDLVDVFDKGSLNKLVPLYDPPANNVTGFRTVFQDWPYNPSQIMQVSPLSYMAKADAGVYLPLKHAADELPYQQTALEAYLSAVTPHNEDGLTTQMDVLLSQGWNMGSIIFAGLHPQAQLAVKVITTLELTARSDSLATKFTEEAPPLDKVAIDHARAAMGKLPDAFPACDNVLGGIVNWIADALESSGVPILAQAASFTKRLDRMAGGAGTRFLDGIF